MMIGRGLGGDCTRLTFGLLDSTHKVEDLVVFLFSRVRHFCTKM